MRWYSRIILSGLLLASFPALSFAQNDICASGGRTEQGDQARAEQLRIQAAERAGRELERRSWEIKMFPMKNPILGGNFGALCIFRIEVVLQSGLKLVQIRAPKELMPAIEEALKMVDVPAPPVTPPKPPRGVELTAYVLVAAERAAVPNWMPVPNELASVANQLKPILPNEALFLADTVVARGIEDRHLGINGSTNFEADVRVRDGAVPVVRLDSLNVSSLGGGFKTSIDVPIGTQVVVGKATADRRAVFLVITAKLLN